MEPFVVTAAFLLIGTLLRRIAAVPAKTGHVLNRFVIYVSLPALVLLKVPQLDFSRHLLVPVLMPWGMLLFSSALILLLSRLLKWERATTGCLLLMVPLGNTSFLGVPMVKAFFGDQAIPYALLYDQLGSFLALATYGSLVLGIYGTGESRPTLGSVLRKVILFPPFIVLVFALGTRTLSYPALGVWILEVLSSTLVPLVMIAVGFHLTLRIHREMVAPLGIGLSIKLVVAPLAALLACTLGGLNGEVVQVSIFESGMPPMVSAGALALLAHLSPTLAAALVGLGIILSFVTLPVLYQLLS